MLTFLYSHLIFIFNYVVGHESLCIILHKQMALINFGIYKDFTYVVRTVQCFFDLCFTLKVMAKRIGMSPANLGLTLNLNQ